MDEAPVKRILIPSDAPRRGELERVLRREGWDPLPYRSASEAEQEIAARPPGAVLVRASDGGAAPLRLVKHIRRVCPDAFVLGMGRSDAETADAVVDARPSPVEVATALRVGELVHHSRETERRLREQLEAVEEATHRQAKRIRELEGSYAELEKTARLAFRDELTRLYNRRYFFQVLSQQLERSRREQSGFAIAMIDIDHFKEYNDTYGHVAGDEMMRKLADTLSRTFRRMDTVARYGGEEFITLMPETPASRTAPFDPVPCMERVRAAVERIEMSPAGTGPAEAGITISIGLVQYPQDGEEIGALITEADARLYRAKAAGRNRVCASPQSTDPQAPGS